MVIFLQSKIVSTCFQIAIVHKISHVFLKEVANNAFDKKKKEQTDVKKSFYCTALNAQWLTLSDPSTMWWILIPNQSKNTKLD